MAKVVVSARLPGRVADILAGHTLVMPATGEVTLARPRLEAELADADALLAMLTLRVDDALLARAPRLKVVANNAVGYDNIDVAAAARRGVLVTNTPDVLTDATADHTLALVLAAARRLGEARALVDAGGWSGWDPESLLGLDLDGALLGIVGLGRIGAAVARRARAFGLRIAYAQPRPAPELAEQLGARRLPLAALLAESDVVSLHCPLTPDTRGLLGARELDAMKPGAILVNTARGALVDEAALVERVVAGRLRAALDVFADEPRIPAALLASPYAVVTPHVGSATVVTRRRMAELAAANIADVLAGRRPPHLVTPPPTRSS